MKELEQLEMGCCCSSDRSIAPASLKKGGVKRWRAKICELAVKKIVVVIQLFGTYFDSVPRSIDLDDVLDYY